MCALACPRVDFEQFAGYRRLTHPSTLAADPTLPLASQPQALKQTPPTTTHDDLLRKRTNHCSTAADPPAGGDKEAFVQSHFKS